MMDLQGNFIYFVLAAFGLGLVSNSVAMALGCALPDVKDVTELSPLLFVPQVLFAGFFIRTSQIPVFLRWAQYLCGMKYGIDLIFQNEFDLKLSSCRSGNARVNCRSILQQNDIKTGEYYIPIISLFLLFIGFRLIAGIILVQKAKEFY